MTTSVHRAAPNDSSDELPILGTGRARIWLDALAASDPGLNRLRSALRAVVTIAVALLGEYAFVHVTHALELPEPRGAAPAGAVAEVALQHHAVLVTAMLLGAVVGMISSMAVNDPTPRQQLTTMLLLPVPMIALLAVGIALSKHRLVSLVSLVVLLTLGTYLRRFGPRGAVSGLLLFFGFFLGYFLSGEVVLGQVGWLAADIGIGLIAAILVRFTVFYPHPAAALRRTQVSWIARGRSLLALAEEVIEASASHAAGADPGHSLARLRRKRLGLIEATLIIDAQLSDDGALPAGSSARRLHERLFDMELAISQIARFAEASTRVNLPAVLRPAIRRMMAALRVGDMDVTELEARALVDRLATPLVDETVTDRRSMILAHRLAGATLDLVTAQREWLRLGAAADDDGDQVFTPASQLMAGWLPGSTLVSSQASTSAGRTRGNRLALTPWTRAAIQICVAVSAAIAVGDVVSGRRFYWAVIAVFVSFFGANNSVEQARKAGNRIIGTAVGIVLGSVLAHLAGHSTAWSLTIVLIALFFGFYLMRVSYAFLVIGITVMISQLYEQLGEFSDSLLILRLEETAIGAAIGILTVMFVVPLRPRRVLTIAVGQNLSDLQAVIATAGRRLSGRAEDAADEPQDIRALARALDASHQALTTTAKPLRSAVLGAAAQRLHTSLLVLDTCWNHARSLAGGLDDWPGAAAVDRAALDAAVDTLHASLAEIIRVINDGGTGRYVRSEIPLAGILRQLERPGNLVAPGWTTIRELMLIDTALAAMASALGLTVAQTASTVSRATSVADPAGRDVERANELDPVGTQDRVLTLKR